MLVSPNQEFLSSGADPAFARLQSVKLELKISHGGTGGIGFDILVHAGFQSRSLLGRLLDRDGMWRYHGPVERYQIKGIKNLP